MSSKYFKSLIFWLLSGFFLVTGQQSLAQTCAETFLEAELSIGFRLKDMGAANEYVRSTFHLNGHLPKALAFAARYFAIKDSFVNEKTVRIIAVENRTYWVKTGNSWASNYAPRENAPHWSPMRIINFIGFETAQFLGVKMISPQRIDVTEFLNQEVLDRKARILREHLGFFPRIKLVEGDIPNNEMITHFARGELALSRTGSIQLHDFSAHFLMAFLPESVWRTIQKEAQYALRQNAPPGYKSTFGSNPKILGSVLDSSFGNALFPKEGMVKILREHFELFFLNQVGQRRSHSAQEGALMDLVGMLTTTGKTRKQAMDRAAQVTLEYFSRVVSTREFLLNEFDPE